MNTEKLKRGIGNMARIIIRALVRRDGTLTVSKRDREKLRQHAGEFTEVALTESVPNLWDREQNPLLQMIGMFEGGKTDGSTNHDKYLYQEPAA